LHYPSGLTTTTLASDHDKFKVMRLFMW